MRGAQETEAYQFISALVYDQCRIRLDESKRPLINSRLGKRLRQLGLNSLAEYCTLLRSPACGDEVTHIVNALSTNFTHFMRESDHFRFLVHEALPKLLGSRKRFRIWSAACSSGEEPFTIAFFLAEHFPPAAGWDWQIVATDVSTKALDKAIAGVYPQERLQEIPRDWHSRYFQRGQGSWAGYYRVKPAVRQRVIFQQLNLLSQYSFPEPFEVIFCRNVMIYFDRLTQEQLVHKFGQLTAPHGFLLIGHAESLNGLAIPFRCLRPSIYQKI